MFTRGQKVWTPEFGWVTYERALTATLDTSYDSRLRRIKTSTIVLDAPKGAVVQTRVDSAAKKIATYAPMDIDSETLATFWNLHPGVSVRFSWPATADLAFRARLEELGIELPPNARPMDSGKFGGQPMYAPSSEVYGLENFDIPEKGTLPFALRLAKEGFPIHVAQTV